MNIFPMEWKEKQKQKKTIKATLDYAFILETFFKERDLCHALCKVFANI